MNQMGLGHDNVKSIINILYKIFHVYDISVWKVSSTDCQYHNSHIVTVLNIYGFSMPQNVDNKLPKAWNQHSKVEIRQNAVLYTSTDKSHLLFARLSVNEIIKAVYVH